ncbi:hypothetical protein K7X08_012929 [Anisodus acutangulus]|uniref:WRKY domain-containing protein n=1 Tax=Anisodus acutangulus TaxID=402998 RepID=A0A9Q1MA24_9SOLA|nr:hypothetical protein K7X08_012929 [Anisodus acutangulus]
MIQKSILKKHASPKRPREITTNISTVCVKTTSSDQTSVVKDGYHWRKYGQKVTRDNPSPRAYYKCSFAPTFPVKKKVQRSAKDPSVLVATYEGEHNHPHPSQAEIKVPLVNQARFSRTNDVFLDQNPSFAAAVAAT